MVGLSVMKKNENLLNSQDLGSYSVESGKIRANLNLRKEISKGLTGTVETYKADFKFQADRW